METIEYSRIKTSIDKTYYYTEYLTKETEEESVNKFLDTVLSITEDFKKLISLTRVVESIIYNHFNSLTISEKTVLVNDLNPLIHSCNRIIVLFQSSAASKSAFKTVLADYIESVNLLKEIKTDLEVSVSLHHDTDYNQTVSSFLE
jgi:hypothetical protein